MHCNAARPLVPSYLDGELSEAQAGPLRKHLLACPGCRGVAQDERALGEWFLRSEAVPVPTGFAARVARRAFAGDTGSTVWTNPTDQGDDEGASEGRMLALVLQWTAAAAVLLVLLSIAMRGDENTPRGEVRADNASLEWALDGLDDLNAGGEKHPEPDAEDREPDPAAEAGE